MTIEIDNNPVERWIIFGPEGERMQGMGPVGSAAIQTLAPDETLQLVDEFPEREPLPPESPIDSDRKVRNKRMDRNRWAIAPDSPLTPACQAAWMTWFAAMHRVIVDEVPRDDWPAEPALEFLES